MLVQVLKVQFLEQFFGFQSVYLNRLVLELGFPEIKKKTFIPCYNKDTTGKKHSLKTKGHCLNNKIIFLSMQN